MSLYGWRVICLTTRRVMLLFADLEDKERKDFDDQRPF